MTYLKGIMHQVATLSPLLFGVVMDVFPSDMSSGIPSELLYADDLVLVVMVVSSDGKGPSGKAVHANTVKGTVCKRWIHKPYSVVRDKLSVVVDGLMRKRCDNTIQGAGLSATL